MVRENRIKDYTFSQTDLTVVAGSKIDIYTDHVINGVIQQVYWNKGNVATTGSLIIRVSGLGAEGDILVMKSGTLTGHHLGEDWAVFPRATTVTTLGSPMINELSQIPVNSILRVIGSGLGVPTVYGEQLSILYI